MIKKEVCIGLLLSFIIVNGFAQISENAIPLSVSENLPEVISYVELEALDWAKLADNNSKQLTDGRKTYKFAQALLTDFSPENSGEC